MLSNDGAYFGFCIISQVRFWYRTRCEFREKHRKGDEESCTIINQRHRVLLSDGASAQPLEAVSHRDKPSTCMITYGS